jgi:hypothetical protein
MRRLTYTLSVLALMLPPLALAQTAPSCSVTFDLTSIQPGAYTTMYWSSSGAQLFYINNVGYVGASGSAQVFSAGDYSGSIFGAGGTIQCAATLTSSGNQSTTSG